MAASEGQSSINSLIAQKLLFSPKQQMSLRDYQNQQALSQALLGEGLKGVDPNNRMMGQIAYKISPWEGVGKIAQALAGAYGENQANKTLTDALSGSGEGSSQNTDGSTATGISGLNLPPGAGLNLDKATEAMFNNYYADHRPGATYRDAKGNMTTARTDQQLNDQSAPASGNGVVPPPVQSAALPPPQPADVPSGTIPPSTAGIQLEGSAIVPPNGAAIGSPDALGPSAPIRSAVPNPPGPGQFGILPGESSNAYHARLEALKAGAVKQAEVGPSGDKKFAEDMGANQAETAKDYNLALSTFPAFHKRSVGLQDNALKSNFSPFNTSEGNGVAPFISAVRGGPTASANTYLEKAKEQGLINQMGLQLSQADIGRSKFLGGIIKDADSIDLSKRPKQLVDQINLNYKNYISNLMTAHDAAIAAGNKNVAPLPLIPMQTPKGPHLIHIGDIDEVLKGGGSFINPPNTQ